MYIHIILQNQRWSNSNKTTQLFACTHVVVSAEIVLFCLIEAFLKLDEGARTIGLTINEGETTIMVSKSLMINDGET